MAELDRSEVDRKDRATEELLRRAEADPQAVVEALVDGMRREAAEVDVPGEDVRLVLAAPDGDGFETPPLPIGIWIFGERTLVGDGERLELKVVPVEAWRSFAAAHAGRMLAFETRGEVAALHRLTVDEPETLVLRPAGGSDAGLERRVPPPPVLPRRLHGARPGARPARTRGPTGSRGPGRRGPGRGPRGRLGVVAARSERGRGRPGAVRSGLRDAFPPERNAPMSSAIQLRLPDGSTRQVAAGTTVLEVAEGIGAAAGQGRRGRRRRRRRRRGLAPAPARRRDFRILTAKDAEALHVLRHSAAHLLAMAVLELFPGTDLGFGPATDDGFYYDFHTAEPHPGGGPPQDRGADEGDRRREAALRARRHATARRAKERLAGIGYELKIPHVDEIPEDEITFYDSGAFTDMCEGPHVPDTGWLQHFKLLSVSGALLARRRVRRRRCSACAGPPSSPRTTSTRT